MILSNLNEDELRSEASLRPWPKWSTLCALRLLGLPTLDAALVPPGSSQDVALETCDLFASLNGLSHLLIRSDAPRESKQYFRGGDSLPLSKAATLMTELLGLGRSVILMEPTNRFANKLSTSARITADGQLDFEILGSGYDVSDLNRGGVPPQFTASIQVQSWEKYAPLWPFDIKWRKISTVNEAYRRQIRLANIGEYMLPNMGITFEGEPSIVAETWLREMGYLQLWEPQDPSLSLKVVRGWYEAAFLTAAWYNKLRHWKCLALTGSHLADGRFIYWDVVDAATKFDIGYRPVDKGNRDA
jgi:hypothetical protein